MMGLGSSGLPHIRALAASLLTQCEPEAMPVPFPYRLSEAAQRRLRAFRIDARARAHRTIRDLVECERAGTPRTPDNNHYVLGLVNLLSHESFRFEKYGITIIYSIFEGIISVDYIDIAPPPSGGSSPRHPISAVAKEAPLFLFLYAVSHVSIPPNEWNGVGAYSVSPFNKVSVMGLDIYANTHDSRLVADSSSMIASSLLRTVLSGAFSVSPDAVSWVAPAIGNDVFDTGLTGTPITLGGSSDVLKIFTTSAGTGLLCGGGSMFTITGATGNIVDTYVAGNSADMVIAAGNAVDLTGAIVSIRTDNTADVVASTPSSNSVIFGGINNVLALAGGIYVITVEGATTGVTGAVGDTGSLTVTGAATMCVGTFSGLVLGDGSGVIIMVGGSGDNTITNHTGATVIAGGTGNLVANLSDTGNIVANLTDATGAAGTTITMSAVDSMAKTTNIGTGKALFYGVGGTITAPTGGGTVGGVTGFLTADAGTSDIIVKDATMSANVGWGHNGWTEGQSVH